MKCSSLSVKNLVYPYNGYTLGIPYDVIMTSFWGSPKFDIHNKPNIMNFFHRYIVVSPSGLFNVYHLQGQSPFR